MKIENLSSAALSSIRGGFKIPFLDDLFKGLLGRRFVRPQV